MTQSSKVYSQADFCKGFIVDLLMQHKLFFFKIQSEKLEDMENEPNNNHIP